VQPTDHVSGRFSCLKWHESRKEERACSRIRALRATRSRPMKDRLFRLAVTLSSVAAMAIAGGASLKGF